MPDILQKFIWSLTLVVAASGAAPDSTRSTAHGASPPPGAARVSTAAELTAALAKGGIITLQPGTYRGNFVVSVDGTEVVAAGRLPERRVSPADVQAVTLAPADQYSPTLRIAASEVTVRGLRILNGAPDRETVVVGSPDATRADAQPDGVTLDRVAVVAGERGGRRGVSLHTRCVAVTRSHIAGFWFRGRDSQAIWVNNGPGPYTIDDNYLEGSGENILFGGASIRIRDCVPSDVRITRNTIAKPEAWRAHKGSVKNSVEFKAVRRALVEGNLIDGNWKDAQAGDTIVLTPRNQYRDSPWVVVEEVTIRGNTVKRTRDGYAVSILGQDNNAPSGQTAHVTIERNLFADARGGIKVVGGVAGALVIRRNTFPAIAYNWMLFSGRGPKTPLTVTDNVTRSGEYGISGDGKTAVGLPSLLAMNEVVDFSGNVIERSGRRSIKWPDGNTLLAPGELARVLAADTFKHKDATVGY
jgi:Right handed beta helix region